MPMAPNGTCIGEAIIRKVQMIFMTDGFWPKPQGKLHEDQISEEESGN